MKIGARMYLVNMHMRAKIGASRSSHLLVVHNRMIPNVLSGVVINANEGCLNVLSGCGIHFVTNERTHGRKIFEHIFC